MVAADEGRGAVPRALPLPRLDARSSARFQGSEPDPRPGVAALAEFRRPSARGSAPTLLVQGTADTLFTPSEAIRNFELIKRSGVHLGIAVSTERGLMSWA